jgi:hypothetical protein
MSSPFVRRSATVTAGAAVVAALAAPLAAHAAEPAGLGPIPGDAVTVGNDPDGAGTLYTLTRDVTTTTTITMPDGATLDGAGHTITAVEDAGHRNFPGPVVASAVGDGSGPAELDIKNLSITTQGFEGGSNSGGLLSGISMYRSGGSLTNVSVDGISHGNGVQEGTGISIRNRVSGDDINVPRAKVELSDVEVTNYQKAGLLLDGNLTFTVEGATVGQGSGPQGQPNPTIAANSLQVSRGASGSVKNSTIALNSHEQAAGVLLYNARDVDLDGVSVTGEAPATSGVYVWNDSNTIDTAFTMRGGQVTRNAAPAGGTGLVVDGPAGAIKASVTDTTITGWQTETDGELTRSTTPEVRTVDVDGTHKATRPLPRRLRIDLTASKVGAHEVEGKVLRWRIVVDGRRAAAIRQHAGEKDVWAQTFRAGTGKHTVEVVKNGVSQGTYKIFTR